MKALQLPRWLAAQLTLAAVVLLAGIVAALTLHVPTSARTDGVRLVANAAGAAAAAGSYRMEMDFRVEGPGMRLEAEGHADVTDTGEGRGEISLPDGQTLSFLTTADRGWFQLPEGSPMRLGGKEWVSFPVVGGQAALTEDPMDFLAVLAQDGQVLDLGEEEVRGVATRQYRAELDPQALAAMAEDQQGATMSSRIAQLMEDGRADVWLSADGLPRRLRVAVQAQGVEATFAFELFEFGVPVSVTPPPAATVIEVETQAEASRFLTGQ